MSTLEIIIVVRLPHRLLFQPILVRIRLVLNRCGDRLLVNCEPTLIIYITLTPGAFLGKMRAQDFYGRSLMAHIYE